jgi:hypothetical protein
MDEAMLRRRRGASAVAIKASEQRNLAMRILLHSPKDLIAGALAFAAVSAIIANAMFMQAGHHPSPMFRTAVPLAASVPASPLPRPRPVEATLKPADVKLAEVRPAEVKPAAAVSVAAKTNAAPVAAAIVARPPAPIPVSSRSDPVADLIVASRRVAAIQRALTDYGYGQLKPTGTVGTDTQAAIQKFERDRKIPITGQMSDRLVRELSAVTGRAID